MEAAEEPQQENDKPTEEGNDEEEDEPIEVWTTTIKLPLSFSVNTGLVPGKVLY